MAESIFLTLNNGIQMPALGLGLFRAPAEETTQTVETAIGAGYRLLDTAAGYLNERAVGEGIRRSGIDRSELFVTTKLWVTDYGHAEAMRAFDLSLGRLGLEYLDLYLLHWPTPDQFDKTVAAYRAAEKLLAEGRVRAIGICNFVPSRLETLIDQSEVVPAVNQVELHPFYNQRETREANARHGTITQSWSPIGGVFALLQSMGREVAAHPLEDPVILDLASKYGKTAAQIIIRWHLEHGLSVIPKSVKPHRIAENIDVFDFQLTSDELARIDELDKGVRAGPDPELFTRDSYKVDITAQ